MIGRYRPRDLELIRSIVREELRDQYRNEVAKAFAAEHARITPTPLGFDGLLMPPGPAVYFILCDSPIRHVKIGHTRSISQRLSNLQAASPFDLTLQAFCYCDNPEEIERQQHERWSRLRRRGEWFFAAPELLAFVAELGEANRIDRDAWLHERAP